MTNKHAIIIGGGISGLTLAYHLSKEKTGKITILEASGGFGGILRTLRSGAFRMEAAADAFDGGETDALDLCAELGLKSELLECGPALQNIFFSQGRKIFPVDLSDPLKTFLTPVLGLRSRARLLLETIVPPRRESSDESIAAFVRRRFGKSVLRELVTPLVRGVLMGEAEKLSLDEYFFPWRFMEYKYGGMIKAILKRKGRAPKARPFFTLRGGLEQWPEALMKKLSGTILETRAEVTSVKHEGKWKVFLKNGRNFQADTVCLALPACGAARLLWDFAPSLAQELARIRYEPVLTFNMVFPHGVLPERFLVGGFIVPARGKKWPFANLKMIGKTEDGNFYRIRAFFSGTFQPEAFTRNDEALKTEVLKTLAEEWGIRAAPLWTSTERYLEGLAQYDAGHKQLIADIEHKLRGYPGLFLTGNGYHGFGISDCVREAHRAAVAMGAFRKCL